MLTDPLLFMTASGRPIVSPSLDRSLSERPADDLRRDAATARELPEIIHDEPALVLACTGDARFFHFLHGALGKLTVAELHGISPLTHAVYLNAGFPWQTDALRLLGITPQPLAGGVVHRFRRGVIPTYAGGSVRPSRQGVGFLRSRFRRPEADGLPGRKLFLSRQSGVDRRLLENEAEIYDRNFRPRGYELVDAGTLSFFEQCMLFSQATHVAGPHGAAFSLLCLGRIPMSVIELHSPHYHAACFRRIANVLGVHHAAFNGRNGLFLPAEWCRNYSLDAAAVAAWLATLPPDMT